MTRSAHSDDVKKIYDTVGYGMFSYSQISNIVEISAEKLTERGYAKKVGKITTRGSNLSYGANIYMLTESAIRLLGDPPRRQIP